jgi:hypothetical protein
MDRLSDASGRGTDPAHVATVTGRNRLPADVIGELMDVLADEPRIVVCDLTRMAPTQSAMGDLFAPLASYLATWPGSLVVVCVPDPSVHVGALPDALADRLVVCDSAEAGIAEARRRLPPLEHITTHLPPVLTASRDARAFATRTMLDWRLAALIGPGSLVVSELVTNSIVHAATVLDLTLSRVDTRVRIGVRDHGGGRPTVSRGGEPEPMLDGRGLMLVQAFTRSWGVFPARGPGKTVWAVMDGARSAPRQGQRPRATS